MSESDSARISPTAHYTGYVWYRNGLSEPAFMTREGWMLHTALRPMNAVYSVGGRAGLDEMLLARHRVIDHLLAKAIDAGEINQVVEVAAGLSPRGHRFSQRYPNLVYVEADLPAMASRKRSLLNKVTQASNHHVVDVDALADEGPSSLWGACSDLLSPHKGTALITEGLLGYFSPAHVAGMWRRFSRFLAGYSAGLYLSDLHTHADAKGMRSAAMFQRLLSMFARGRVHLHFDGPVHAERALVEAGFATARVHDPGSFAGEVELPNARRFVVQVVEARS